jgi:hypothetical protein
VVGRVSRAGADVMVKDVEAWLPTPRRDWPSVKQRLGLK